MRIYHESELTLGLLAAEAKVRVIIYAKKEHNF